MPPRPTSPISFARHNHTPEDISRLLDPAYSSNAFASTSAYVDTHGDLHDPDYRHFPIATQPPKRRTSNYTMNTRPRPRWETFDEDEDEEEQEEQREHLATSRRRNARPNSFSSYQHKRPSYTPTPYVPASFDSEDTVLDEEDDEYAFQHPRSTSVSRIFSRTKRELMTRKRRSLDSATTASPPSPYYTPTLLLPDTPATTVTAVSQDDAASLHAPSHHHPLTHSLSRQSHHSDPSPHATTFTPLYPSHHHSRAHSSHSHSSTHSHTPTPVLEYVPSEDAPQQAWTPTCAQALRRQWQAISLSVRFGIFRAQRRMRSRLAML